MPPVQGSKVVLVTGSTEGIGLATAHQLCAKGVTVLVHGRTSLKVQAVVDALKEKGGLATGYTADLSSMAEVRRLGAEVAAAWPSLDGLLNNAGSFDGDYTGKKVVTPEVCNPAPRLLPGSPTRTLNDEVLLSVAGQ